MRWPSSNLWRPRARRARRSRRRTKLWLRREGRGAARRDADPALDAEVRDEHADARHDLLLRDGRERVDEVEAQLLDLDLGAARGRACEGKRSCERAERRPSRTRERADDLARDDEVDRDLDRLVRVDVVGLAQELAGERVLVDADRGAADLHVDARELEVRVERDRVDGLDHDVEAHGPGEAEVEVREEALEAPATRNGPHQRRSRVRRARFGRDVVRETREKHTKKNAGCAPQVEARPDGLRGHRVAELGERPLPRPRDLELAAVAPAKTSRVGERELLEPLEGVEARNRARRGAQIISVDVRCGRRRKTARPRGGCRARAAGSRGRAP